MIKIKTSTFGCSLKIILIITIIILVFVFIIQMLKKDIYLDSFTVSNEVILNNNNNYPVLYINLENRDDRKIEIENELEKEGIFNYMRFNAIKNNKKGYLGCSQSHIDCLKIAKQNNYPNVIIFEDDFEFLIDKNEFHNLLENLLHFEYDVFLLSYNTFFFNIKETKNSLFNKIKGSQTASGYIVNKKYYDKLINNFEEGLKMLKKTDIYSKYAIDQYWKSLQNTDNWFCYKKRIGKQRESYSDIEKRKVNYQV